MGPVEKACEELSEVLNDKKPEWDFDVTKAGDVRIIRFAVGKEECVQFLTMITEALKK